MEILRGQSKTLKINNDEKITIGSMINKLILLMYSTESTMHNVTVSIDLTHRRDTNIKRAAYRNIPGLIVTCQSPIYISLIIMNSTMSHKTSEPRACEYQ